jgi:hypothetical protein
VTSDDDAVSDISETGIDLEKVATQEEKEEALKVKTEANKAFVGEQHSRPFELGTARVRVADVDARIAYSHLPLSVALRPFATCSTRLPPLDRTVHQSPFSRPVKSGLLD